MKPNTKKSTSVISIRPRLPRMIRCFLGAMLTIAFMAPVVAVSQTYYTGWSDMGIIDTSAVGNAYYPSVIYDWNGFGGLANYAMWYSDGNGSVYLVASTDGFSWGAPTIMTGLNNAYHAQVLYDANHFGLGSGGPKYKIWFWVGNMTYTISDVSTAESVDGINWNNNQVPITQNASAKLVYDDGVSWNRGIYGPVHLFYQPSSANSGTDPWSYSYVMYYDGTDGSHEVTGLAYSADGYVWTAYSTDPVLSFAVSPAWDSEDAVYGTVYKDALGFHYWYSGGVSSPNDGIGYAFSTDGKTWVKNPNHIFHISDGVAYRNERVNTPSVIDDGTGTLKMYYTAQAIGRPKKIGMAISVIPPLPVELVSFIATGTRNGASLVWKTATEKNNYGFNIERRTVGSSTWSKVGFVAGHGTSNSANSYSYADANVAAGTYAYRVAQVDNDGTVKTYNESQVTVGAATKALSLSNYPNPFNPTTTLEFSVPNDGKTTVKIYNVLGQEVVTAFSGEAKAGQFQHATFDGSKFSSGVYFYTIENNGQRMVKKMLMMK